MEAAPYDDRGLTLGDGLFETVLAERGRLVLFDQHLERLTRGCGVLGLPRPNPVSLREAALTALTAGGLTNSRAAVRISWTAGSGGRGLDRPVEVDARLIVSATAAIKPAGPATLALSSVRRNAGSPVSRLKSLAYLDNVLARREARAAGADEAVMLNGAGELACAAAANLFWVSEGRLYTPALHCGVLDGIMRAVVLRQAELAGVTVIEAHEGAPALARAEAVFITNSLIGVRAVSRFDGQAYQPNALVERLAAASVHVT